MADRILVPYDGSAPARRALDHVAAKHPDAEVTILHVVDPIGVVYEAEAHGLPEAEGWPKRAQEAAERLCAAATRTVEEAGCAATTVIEFGRPADEILAYVEDHDIDQVVMGSRGRSGLSRLALGSTAERVMRRAAVPVTVVR